MLLDGWRLSAGTLTAWPVAPPRAVDRRRTGLAMVLAPLAVWPLALAAAAMIWLGHLMALSALVVGVLVVGAVVVGNRAFHLDGLSDTVDGLAASHEAQRSLQVMKSGTSGPAGTAAVVLVLALQVAGVSAIVEALPTLQASVLVAMIVAVSRNVLVVCCAAGVPHARDDGLGRGFAASVPPMVATAAWMSATALVSLVGRWAGLEWWRGGLAALLALGVALALIRHTCRRFGGVTGDVFGCAIELSLATLLVSLS